MRLPIHLLIEGVALLAGRGELSWGMDPILRTETGSKGRFYAEREGQLLGELTYSRAGDDLVILDHTAVTDLARGTGLGRRLVQAAVDWARESGTKIIPLCPYARSVFDKEPALGDVLRT